MHMRLWSVIELNYAVLQGKEMEVLLLRDKMRALEFALFEAKGANTLRGMYEFFETKLHSRFGVKQNKFDTWTNILYSFAGLRTHVAQETPWGSVKSQASN